MKDNVSFDPCQQEVIEARGGWHLVLAPPGCGKTQILTERIRRAHSEGVAYAVSDLHQPRGTGHE